jgi:hypothetical protein
MVHPDVNGVSSDIAVSPNHGPGQTR